MTIEQRLTKCGKLLKSQVPIYATGINSLVSAEECHTGSCERETNVQTEFHLRTSIKKTLMTPTAA